IAARSYTILAARTWRQFSATPGRTKKPAPPTAHCPCAVVRNSFPECRGRQTWRRGEQIGAEVGFLGEAEEVPLVGEGAVVVPRQLPQHHAPRQADTQRILEQID